MRNPTDIFRPIDDALLPRRFVPVFDRTLYVNWTFSWHTPGKWAG